MRVVRSRFLAEALGEMRDAAGYYGDRSSSLGERFTRAVEHAHRIIREHPEIGRPYLAGTRRMLVEGFPYSLIYRVRSTDLHILAIPHHRRKPDYWIDRG